METKYFEEKFCRVFDKLDTIEKHVRETNGKVANHEKRIQDIELKEAREICPNTPIVDNLAKMEIKNGQIRKAFYWFVGVVLSGVVLQILGAIGIF